MGLSLSCDGQICSGHTQPRGLPWSSNRRDEGLPSPKGEVNAPAADSGMVPGMSRRDQDSIDRFAQLRCAHSNFPDREFSIGLPGSLKFNGVKSRCSSTQARLHSNPSKIENKNYNLGLDIGSSISFLLGRIIRQAGKPPIREWPHMTGAVGPANMGEAGDDEEPKWKLIARERLQYDRSISRMWRG